MSRIGVPVASLPMSVATLAASAAARERSTRAWRSRNRARAPISSARCRRCAHAGALTVAAVNVPGSPLADACEWNLPLLAGPELSVAATKSYIAMLSIVGAS